MPVDRQSDQDLGVDAAFFGVADLAQRVLVLGFEVQGRDVVEAQRHITAGGRIAKVGGRDLVPVTCGADTRARSRRCSPRPPWAGSANNPASCRAGGTSGTFLGAGSISRSSSPCPGSASIPRACSSRRPSSASVCAEPPCVTIRRRPSTYSAICTAVAPEAVHTRRTHATTPIAGHRLVPQISRTTKHHHRSTRYTRLESREGDRSQAGQPM